MLEKSNGTLIHSQKRGLAIWAEHFKEQFIWPIATVGLSLFPVNELMQVDTGPPFEIEVIREIGFLQRYKAAGPGGLSPS